jgi:hypothetical protein
MSHGPATSSELRGPDIHGRIDVTPSRNPHGYRHAAEHRGSGIVCIYSYGPLGEHDSLVRSAAQIMRKRFGVSDAVSSGGISGWPQDEHSGGPANNRTVETQTTFCIDAVSGPNRKRPRQVSPSGADWHVAYVVDLGQSYLGDGETDLYYTGPYLDEEEWQELVDRMVCDSMSEEEHRTLDKAGILNLTVRALSQGRYWFLSDGDPVISIERFEVTP